jgi:hypothetical protein
VGAGKAATGLGWGRGEGAAAAAAHLQSLQLGGWAAEGDAAVACAMVNVHARREPFEPQGGLARACVEGSAGAVSAWQQDPGCHPAALHSPPVGARQPG